MQKRDKIMELFVHCTFHRESHNIQSQEGPIRVTELNPGSAWQARAELQGTPGAQFDTELLGAHLMEDIGANLKKSVSEVTP